LRALCVAHWARHPDSGKPARVIARGEPAAAALDRWRLVPHPTAT
jgi:glycerol 3-phosphatase-2